MRNSIVILALSLLTSANLLAQQAVGSDVAMADLFRSEGKIWVVVAVVAIVLTGLLLYLVRLDQKIQKVEKELKIK
jgi:CcmD family protein